MMEQKNSSHFTEPFAFINAPAPWRLRGNGYICLLRCPSALVDNQSFVMESLQGKGKKNAFSLLIFVDYVDSPVGPYRELLFIPGRFSFQNGYQYHTISRIFVSSMDSVVNGRHNWGIPKEIAEFDVHYDKQQRLEQVTVTQQSILFAELKFRSLLFPLLPFNTSWLPESWRSFGQYYQDSFYAFHPKANGWLQPARLMKIFIDPSMFPPICLEQVVAVMKVANVDMVFPEAKKIQKI